MTANDNAQRHAPKSVAGKRRLFRVSHDGRALAFVDRDTRTVFAPVDVTGAERFDLARIASAAKRHSGDPVFQEGRCYLPVSFLVSAKLGDEERLLKLAEFAQYAMRTAADHGLITPH